MSSKGKLPSINSILTVLHSFCPLGDHLLSICITSSLCLSIPLLFNVNGPLLQSQLIWIKYSTCQVASLEKSCSQASSARAADQWEHSVPK